MDLELISFPTCPYVQRSVITLREKGAPYQIQYIDLGDPPAWFKDISPLGKVPLLRTTEGVLFESAVINEYVDEVTEGTLMPTDPWQKAVTRAWIEFGGECNMDMFNAMMAQDEETYARHRDALVAKLGRLNDQFVGPFFLGETLTLADCALTPLLMRVAEFGGYDPRMNLSAFPKLAAWYSVMGKRESVKGSIDPKWREMYREGIEKRGGYLASLVTA